MAWRDKFWSAYGMVRNTAIDLTVNTVVNTCNIVGSLACMAGGVGFALSNVLDETLRASYYGSALTTGAVLVDANLKTFNYHFNESIPFERSDYVIGDLTYNLKDYIHPEKVRVASSIFFASGTALRLIGTNVKQWRQGRLDKAYYKSEHDLEIANPSRKEYLYASAESLCGSISFTFLSASIAGEVINYTGLVGSSQSLTYPTDGMLRVNATHYEGPLKTLSIPVAYKISKDISINLYGLNIKALVEERVNALANTTYGGGLFFKSEVTANPPVVIPAAVGGSAFLAGSFFARKVGEERDERIYKTIDHKNKYDPLNI